MAFNRHPIKNTNKHFLEATYFRIECNHIGSWNKLKLYKSKFTVIDVWLAYFIENLFVLLFVYLILVAYCNNDYFVGDMDCTHNFDAIGLKLDASSIRISSNEIPLVALIVLVVMHVIITQNNRNWWSIQWCNWNNFDIV